MEYCAPGWLDTERYFLPDFCQGGANNLFTARSVPRPLQLEGSQQGSTYRKTVEPFLKRRKDHDVKPIWDDLEEGD